MSALAATTTAIGGVVAAARIDNWIGLGVAVALTVYLIAVLLFPERF